MSYKLHYFNGRGRAELIRLVFAQAGQKFEDIRVEKDKWPALKPNAPFGAMPYLEMDGGVKLCQSAAIARFLARKFGLAGKTDLEQAQADMFIDCYEDTVKPMFSFFFEPDEAKKGELKKKFIEEQLPKSLAGLESLLKANKGGDGFCVGDGVTWADLGFLYMSGWLSMAGADTQLAKYPKLNALREKVSKLPKVAEWLEKRPKTDF